MKSDKANHRLKYQLKKVKAFIVEGGILIEKRMRYLNRPNQDFTRQRKLNFATTVGFILGLLKKA